VMITVHLAYASASPDIRFVWAMFACAGAGAGSCVFAAYNYLHERVQVIMHVHVHVLSLYLVGALCPISGVGPGDHLMLPLVRLVPGENIAHHPSYRRYLPAGELSHVVLTSSYWLTCKRRYFSSRSLLVESAILQGEQKMGSKRPL